MEVKHVKMIMFSLLAALVLAACSTIGPGGLSEEANLRATQAPAACAVPEDYVLLDTLTITPTTTSVTFAEPLASGTSYYLCSVGALTRTTTGVRSIDAEFFVTNASVSNDLDGTLDIGVKFLGSTSQPRWINPATQTTSYNAGNTYTYTIASGAGQTGLNLISTDATAFTAGTITIYLYAEPEAVPEADLELSKTASASSVTLGDSFNYIITITNNGPNAATNVTLTDLLESSFALGTITFDPELDEGDYTLSTDDNDLTFTLNTLGVDASITLTIAVTPQEAGVFTNDAAVTAAELDPNLENNTASVEVTVTEVAPGAVNIVSGPNLGTVYLNRVVDIQLEAMGGVAPYTWSSPDLQFMVRGLNLTPDGRIIGRPLQRYATPRTFTVFVTDANGVMAEQQFTLNVR